MKVGQKASDFTVLDDFGKKLKLSDFKGQKVVLYFYPKDDTPGCTKEACNFRDLHRDLQKLGAKVLGVSPDTVESHGDFRNKFKLNLSRKSPWLSTVSGLTPSTFAPSFCKSRCKSRKLQASFVQPGVSSFG